MKSIEVVSIPVSDQQKAKAFYLSIGFEIIVEAPMGDNGDWIQLGLPGQATSITLVTWFPKMQPGQFHGMVLASQDIEQETEALKEKGVKVDPIDQTPWGRFATFYDLDGNSLTLHQQ
ncbi:MAG: VOC family protein [Bacteroidota bacterium]